MNRSPVSVVSGGWWRGGTIVALVTFGFVLATEPRMAIVWDEGFTLGRVARVRAWFQLLIHPSRAATWHDSPEFAMVQPDREGARQFPRPPIEMFHSRADLFRPQTIVWFWPFAREEPHGHPPFYAWVALAGDILTPWREPLARARLGTMLFFSAIAGVIFITIARRWGAWPGLAAASAWALHPHLFALGHYAHYDALLSSLWVLAIVQFSAAIDLENEDGPRRYRWGQTILFGVILGIALGTKFTGWLLPVPLLVWALVNWDLRAIVTLTVGGACALVVLYVATPPFWANPIDGVCRFLDSNLTRAETILLPIQFLGQIIVTPLESLPWYNTLLWTVMVTPVGFLLLGMIGIWRALGQSRLRTKSTRGSFEALILVNWVFLMVLRALPHTPGHDGVRQFLPAFGCFALLVGIGAAAVANWGKWWARAVVGLAATEAMLSIVVMMPVPLSYFSPLVGGLPGAYRLGMEPTFYWDALDAGSLAWLNAHTPPPHKVQFSTYPLSLLYLRDTGRLTAEVRREVDRPVSWYVLQNRPGLFGPTDRSLLARGQPAHVVRKLGVSLILIYGESEHQAAIRGYEH